jgi:hypothetical protein
MGKSLRNIPDSDSDASDDLSHDDLCLRVVELENALCNQDKLVCKVFRETLSLKVLLFNLCMMI